MTSSEVSVLKCIKMNVQKMNCLGLHFSSCIDSKVKLLETAIEGVMEKAKTVAPCEQERIPSRTVRDETCFCHAAEVKMTPFSRAHTIGQRSSHEGSSNGISK